jgi:hypothetical protein
VTCPRCDAPSLERLAVSPRPGVWEVLHCRRCHYTWRSTEPDRRSSREHYPEQFRLTEADIAAAQPVPPIPPPRASS